MRIVITTTLNDNLFRAKLLPLVRAQPDLEIVVVTDRRGPPLDRVRWVYPEGILRKLGHHSGRFLLLAREIFHPRTRLVMAYNVLPHGVFAVQLARWRRIPVYLHFIAGAAEIDFARHKDISHSRLVARTRHPERLERLAERTARRADRIFVPGSRTRAALVARGFPSDKLIQLHSAVDTKRFSPLPAERDIDVLVVAQLRKGKRPIFTLEILRAILDQRPLAKFCWLGDGPMHDEFETALGRLGLRDAVLWTQTEEVVPLYRRSKTYLLCSLSEGLSLSCMEAMACGVVPVTTNCGDMADVVRDGITGALLPLTAPVSEFVTAIQSHLENPLRWAEFSRAAGGIIEAEHSIECATKAWRVVLSSLRD